MSIVYHIASAGQSKISLISSLRIEHMRYANYLHDGGRTGIHDGGRTGIHLSDLTQALPQCARLTETGMLFFRIFPEFRFYHKLLNRTMNE